MSEKQKSKVRKFLFHPYSITAIVFSIVVLTITWAMGNIIDAKALRRLLESNISSRIGADVTIESLDTHLSISGKWKIRMREINISNTSPDFGPDLFTCRKIVFEGSFIDLLSKKWKPKITIKDWEFTIGIGENGRTSISDLFSPMESNSKKWDGWPFSIILSEQQNINFVNGSIKLTKGFDQEVVLQKTSLSGSGTYQPKNPNEFNGDLVIDLTDNNGFLLNLSIKDFLFNKQKINGKWNSKISIKELPIGALASISTIPLTNKQNLKNIVFEISGDLSKLSTFDIDKLSVFFPKAKIPIFGIDKQCQITAEKILINKNKIWHLKIKNTENDKKDTLNAVLTMTNKLRHLSIECSYMDFSKLSSNPTKGSWEEYILKNVREISVKAKQYSIFGFVINQAEAKFVIDENILLSKLLTGKMAKGKITLMVKNWVMGGKGWPTEIGLFIDHASAPALFSESAHIVSPSIVPTPNKGEISVGLLFPANKNLMEKINLKGKVRTLIDSSILKNNTMPTISAALNIDNELRFDTPGNGAIFNSFWNIYNNLKKLEAKLTGVGLDGKKYKLPCLRIKSGYVLHVTNPDKLKITTAGVLDSFELGKIKIKQECNSFPAKIKTSIKLSPFTYLDDKSYAIRPPIFSNKFMKNVLSIDKKTGLEIVVNSDGKSIENVYLQKLIDRWNREYQIKGEK